MILSGEMEDFNIMNRYLYENCRQQNVSSVFGARRVDGTPTINIFCINCCEEITNFFKCLDVWKSNGNKTEYNVTAFEIPKSLAPFVKSFDMVRMLQRWNVMCFDFDDV